LGVAGDGTLRITNANSSLTALSKSGAGRLTYGPNARLTSLSVFDNGALHIEANGTSAGTSRVGTLTINGGTLATAALDLDNNDLIVTTGSATLLATQIAYARHGGAWDRPGLTSIAAANDPTHATTLGLLRGSEFLALNGAAATFDGFNVAPTDTLIKYTYYGDTDLNGVVNFDDYVRTDNGFNNHLSGWLNGDFDLNGQVNFDDYVLIDLAFNSQSGTLRRALSFLDGSEFSPRGMDDPALRRVRQHLHRFGVDYARHFLAAVPEPAGAGLLAIAGAAGATRRRRRA